MGENYNPIGGGKSRDERRDDALRERIIPSILAAGRMTVERTRPGLKTGGEYPDYVQRALDNISDEQIGEMIQSNPDFSECIDRKGRFSFGDLDELLAGREKKDTVKTLRVMVLKVERNFAKNYEITANVHLLYPKGEKPYLLVHLYANKINYENYPRAKSDFMLGDQCANCGGRGCWECAFGG